MTQAVFEEVLDAALTLNPGDKARLLERIASSLVSEIGAAQQSSAPAPVDDEAPYTEEELAELLRPDPKTGAEIVEMGILGGWADMGITDGAEWVNEQKRKRQEKNRW